MDGKGRQVQYLLRRLGVLLLLLCVGCAEVPIAEDVNQSQATEIVAVLIEHGIAAESAKTAGGHGKYSVHVKRELYPHAITILHERGLPSPQEPSFAETIASKGFLPNSREIESLRVDRAMAAEIEEALRQHPGVSGVKVVVRRATAADGIKAGVSVIIQEKEGFSVNKEDVVQVVVKAVPGIAAEDVFVSSVKGAPINRVTGVEGALQSEGRTIKVPLSPFLGFWNVPESDLPGLSLTLLVGILVIGGLGAFLGYWFGYLQQARQLYEQSLPEIPRPRQLDRPKRVEGEE